MEDMVSQLMKIGFSRLEAQIYLDLLKNKGLTGYQIAKNLDISRSSVYPCLESMYKKGYILLAEGDALTYFAEDSTVLLNRLTGDYLKYTSQLAPSLKTISVDEKEERFINLSGFDQIISKTKDVINQAQKEIIMNIDGDFELIREEIIDAIARGVRVIVFSFIELSVEGLKLEYFSHHNCSKKTLSRIMLVADYDQTIIGDTNLNRGSWLGLLTNNTLFTTLICEHIHHDIYLLKYREIDGSIWQKYPMSNLNTMMETQKQFRFDCKKENK